jgi:chromosome segregation ATPase
MPEKEASGAAAISGEIVRRLNEYNNRIRGLELKFERLENRVGEIEETVLNQLGSLKIGIERLSQKISSVSDRLANIENEILRINKELGKTALKSDVKKIESFIDVVNPITSKFVTRDEVERMLEEKFKAKS